MRPATGSTQPFEVINEAPSSLTSPAPEDTRWGLLENKYWRYNREPLGKAASAAQRGDFEAYKRIEKIERIEYQETFRLGHVPQAKEHAKHSLLFLMGLELGLEKLSAEELADCFDELCDCGEVHDPDALKKQRPRLRKAVANILEEG